MPADLGHQKRALRAELRERRRNLTSSERTAAVDGLTRNLIALTESLGARSVSCYLSATDEPNTRPFLRWADEHSVRVLLPISRRDGLLDWTVATGDDEEVGVSGMPEPVGELLAPTAINDVDLILVPAACVDQSGMRLGWGRGYFDKTLGSMERCPPVYAVVFDSEVVDEVPRERHDQPVNGAVTPARTLRFASSTRS
ncbi:MAG: 5-formyltetrahydrofolate cyclo-ligase-related protein [Naasia sp.]|jgi:5-formyltetrahydrofolate cyclo-ligase|uniref:5-formyltetrahydrofolate cyclo-ligase n=1 Tax=Naasia sp. TaxID=2546198 RepID=UPI0026062D0E|nr:5-formyltetrahydrofolate cyclo-ligase [Naasia sp.]MCU1569508.1 5-formyltetrahydrofolate cyclo-ligase-related protein [Naasia sp.]